MTHTPGPWTNEIYGYVQTEMTDHEFSEWLKTRNWAHTYKVSNSNFFVNRANQTIAVTFYNNEKCTRDIWLHADFAT